MDIRSEAHSTQDTICKTHETQEERRPKCGYFNPSYRGNKIPMEGVTETKFGAETEGMTIQHCYYYLCYYYGYENVVLSLPLTASISLAITAIYPPPLCTLDTMFIQVCYFQFSLQRSLNRVKNNTR